MLNSLKDGIKKWANSALFAWRGSVLLCYRSVAYNLIIVFLLDFRSEEILNVPHVFNFIFHDEGDII